MYNMVDQGKILGKIKWQLLHYDYLCQVGDELFSLYFLYPRNIFTPFCLNNVMPKLWRRLPKQVKTPVSMTITI